MEEEKGIRLGRFEARGRIGPIEFSVSKAGPEGVGGLETLEKERDSILLRLAEIDKEIKRLKGEE